MYVIPKDAVPRGTSLAEADVNALLQNTGALPAGPGEVLGWTFDVVHWGGSVSEDATTPGSPVVRVHRCRFGA